MGQYYKPVCIKTKESLYSHNYENGLKLMEHSYIDNNFVNIVIMMLLDETFTDDPYFTTHKDSSGKWIKDKRAGKWSKKPFVWSGDYSDVEKTLLNPGSTEESVKQCGEDNKYLNWFDASKDIKPDCREFIILIQDYRNMFIYNLDLREYVSMRKYIFNYPDNVDMMIHPLPLLTCDGNGRGGGDFHNENEFKLYVGRWKKHRIAIGKKAPDYFTDITENVYFVE